VNSPIQVDQVTLAQFRNGLSQLGLQVTGEEASLLNRRFAGSASGYVNYVAFACAIDESQRTFSSREPRSYVVQPLTAGFREPRLGTEALSEYQPGRAPTGFNEPKLPTASFADLELSAVLKRLQDKALQHRIRLSEFFFDFDKHCDGTITEPQFIKGLSVAYDKKELGLTESELELLVNEYGKTMVHGARHIQWRKFVADIELVFQAAEMEKDPASKPINRVLQQDVVLLKPADEIRVQQLLTDLRRRVHVRRVLVKPLFSDYGGWSNATKVIDHITRQQAVQSLSRFGIDLTLEEQSLLFERYDTLGTGTVNFVALVRDIDSLESFSGREMRRHAFPQDPDFGSTKMMTAGFRQDRVVPGPILNLQPGRPPTNNDQPRRNSASSPSVLELLSRLQRSAVQHRLRVDENFKDFDRHHDGTITVPQFQAAVAMTWSKHLPLSQAEVETLVRSYSVDKSGQVHVLWKAFASDINKVFNTEALERTPTVAAPSNPPALPLVSAQLSASEEEVVESVLARLRSYCSTRRILVKPFFADAEYNRNSMRVVDHVTRAQFEQCLSRLGLQLNGDELLLLERKFDDFNDGFVNYVLFACAVDTEESGSNRADNTRSKVLTKFKSNVNFKTEKVADAQPGRPPTTADFPSLLSARPSNDVESLIKRIQDKTLQFNIPVQDFLVDYDKHKLGAISRAQFRRGLGFAFGDAYVKESLQEEELTLLEEEFKREMIDGAHYVDWRKFCRTINEARLLPNLETKPTTEPKPRLLERQPVQLNASVDARLQVLLAALAERFRIRSVYVKAPFHDFAKSSNSPMMVDHITRQQLVQGLSRLGIELPQDDLELLYLKYDDESDGSVNYVSFCRDVDATETFSDRSFERDVHRDDTFVGGFRSPKVHEHVLRTM